MIMEILEDVKEEKKLIERSIKKHGWAAEHNYHHYLYDGEDECCFALFENFMGLQTSYTEDTKEWDILGEVLAPEEQRLEVLMDFLHYALNKRKGSKVWVELESSFRKEVLKAIKGKYHAAKPTMTLTWPMFDMKQWDSSLYGKKWKKIRNLLNRFNREHKVKVVPSTKVPFDQLKAILDAWIKNRPKTDRTYSSHYLNAIIGNFKGFDLAKTLVVDGEPCSITAGWKIPNTDIYYSSLGLHNYKYDYLGEVTNIDDLNTLKKLGYKHVDFGGADGTLLEFKKKFRPQRFYDTVTFSIRRL